ncbi:DegT/DnrJ/EryC1/StrS family aminotransferase [Candidatus Daviesbacteria bacterium]|nr:DegT/DnrJ/EryC1/StrS family aminotransferase [Candidatus Daviesbacteria bacterium]
MDFFHSHISSYSIKLVKDTLKSGFISEGKLVKRFEEELEKKLGLINPIALNGATSALHLSLVLAGVSQGDEVIIPAQTFVATGLAVLMQRAKPIFADILIDSGNIDPLSIKKKITKKTKAIIAVHWGGYPCDLKEINEIAKKNNLVVIEDGAHALGAMYRGKPIGSISRFTIFSFQAIKHLTTGDGGALCCFNKKDGDNAKVLRWFGIDRANSKPSILGERKYNINQLGFKYHMNDLAASLGLGNLEDLSKTIKRRQEIALRYRSSLNRVPGVKLLDYKDDRQSSFWLFTILVKKRNKFIKKLLSKNIPSSVVHLRIDHNKIFGGLTPNLFNQERFNQEQISIPIHDALTDQDVELIIKTIKSGW